MHDTCSNSVCSYIHRLSHGVLSLTMIMCAMNNNRWIISTLRKFQNLNGHAVFQLNKRVTSESTPIFGNFDGSYTHHFTTLIFKINVFTYGTIRVFVKAAVYICTVCPILEYYASPGWYLYSSGDSNQLESI